MFTYFFFNPSNELTKIGRSKNPIKRIRSLSATQNVILEPKCIFNGDTEKHQHQKYDEFWMGYEWFKLPELVLSEISLDPQNIISEFIPFVSKVPVGLRPKERSNYFGKLIAEDPLCSPETEFGRSLFNEKARLGLKYTEIAKILEVSVNKFKDWEAGYSTPAITHQEGVLARLAATPTAK